MVLVLVLGELGSSLEGEVVVGREGGRERETMRQ